MTPPATPPPPPTIALIGLRASGKTSAGHQLAQRLGREFVDLDQVTPRYLSAETVAAAWNRHGQAAFRRAELRALVESLARDGIVLALGGGTPTAPGAADLILAERDAGRLRVVYLAAPAATLRERLRHGGVSERPSLTGADPISEIDSVLADRDPLYRQLAGDVLDTSGKTIDAVVEELAALLAAR